MIQTFASALLCAVVALTVSFMPAARAAGGALVSQAKSWVLMDSMSGCIMEQKNARRIVNPGDLVQLMTLYTALERLDEIKRQGGEVSRTTIHADDVAQAQSMRRIYLAPDDKADLQVLLRAVAVINANDAALAVSRHTAESHAAFAEHMNRFAALLGMTDSTFVGPIAHPKQKTSARDLALLSAALYRQHPAAFAWLNEKNFSYAQHRQRNRNQLLWKGHVTDGIMASASNKDLISSWHRAGTESVQPRHIFAVLLGAESAESAINDMQTLLINGRTNYETLRLFPANVPIKKIDILSGNRETLEVGSPREMWVTVNRQAVEARGTGGFSAQLRYLAPAVAPVKTGDPIGTLEIYFENTHVADFPMHAMHDVGQGSFLSRFVDSVRLRMKPTETTRTPIH
ncbi:MAG: D-alanyl-D-alanine carboxypeptidase family protein [Duodenibacillus sp.]